MTPKSILVLVDGGPLSESTLETGLAVAGLFGAQVQALHVQADPATLVPIVGEGMSGAMVEQVMDAMSKAVDQRSERAKAAYDKIAARGGAKIAWRLESGPEPVVLAAAGRLVRSDRCSAGPTRACDGQTAASLDAALFDTGRAVLVAPPAATAPQRLPARGAGLERQRRSEPRRRRGAALSRQGRGRHHPLARRAPTSAPPPRPWSAISPSTRIKATVESFELHRQVRRPCAAGACPEGQCRSAGHGCLWP